MCLFPNDDYTGNYAAGPVLIDPSSPFISSGTWYDFEDFGASDPNPGSVNNNSGSCLWVFDAQKPVESGNPFPVLPGRVALDHSFGHFEIFYADSGCNHNFTRPLP
jgi:hypothetical protein